MSLPPTDPPSPAPARASTRLAKVVAALVPCSRSEAERYIAEGRVRVNGRVVDAVTFQVRDERVEVDAGAKLQPRGAVTFVLHKPAGVTTEAAQGLLTAPHQWPADHSGLRRLPNQSAGLSALLPLPAAAQGLSVFSQDFRIVRKLQEEAHLVEQELVAQVTGTLAEGGLQRLGRGWVHQGRTLPPARVSWQSETRLRIAAKGLPPESIGWMCEQVGLQLVALKRIRIGRLPMAGLPAGQWRFLLPTERF